MQVRRPLAALAGIAIALAVAGCGKRPHEAGDRNNTAVLGSAAPSVGAALSDASGQPIPAPPAPAKTVPRTVRCADDAALAVWIQDEHVVASAWTRAAGWAAPQPLERIYGQSSDPQLASNGKGQAMVLWQHRVGNIHSLRFSRFDAATGWSAPDVLPGALPRPNVSGRPDSPDLPQLQMDAQGGVTARWPSGFHANETQEAHYTPGQGWGAATSAPVASAPGGSPANPAPSSVR